jgi:hypothetical protein
VQHSILYSVRALSLVNCGTCPLCACLSCRPAELAPGAEAQFSALQQDYQLLLLARLDLQRRGLGWQLEGQGGGDDADEEGAASGQLGLGEEDLAWGDSSQEEEDAEDEDGQEEGEEATPAAARYVVFLGAGGEEFFSGLRFTFGERLLD